MITLKKWDEMSFKDRSEWLADNMPASNRSRSLRGKVRGFGINDAPYITTPTIEGKTKFDKPYETWMSMIARVYGGREKHMSYSGVVICDEWRSFMSFREWWLSNYVEGWNIDKDLTGDAREYSPKTCVFVPCWINNFTVGSGIDAVERCKMTGKFRARCRNPITKKREHVGWFPCANSALDAWKKRKLEFALVVKGSMDSIDPRIYPRVVEIISNAK